MTFYFTLTATPTRLLVMTLEYLPLLFTNNV